jgi:hypothetical protein
MQNAVTRWYPAAFLMLNSLALVITGLASLAANAEFQSAARTALSGMVFLLAALCLAGGLWLAKNEAKRPSIVQHIQQSAWFVPFSGLVFTLTWPLAWLPAEKSGSLYYYFLGIQPLVGWATFASGLALLLGLSLRPDFSIEKGLAYWRNQKPTLKIALAALLLFALTAVLINWLKIWAANEPYWWGAGVPLLIWQVYLILLASILLWRIRFKLPRFSNILIFFGIWGISAWLWASQPLQPSFFFTPPLFPNHELYPFADLEFFDRSAQYALIGQGINNGFFFDRTLYIAFVIYLQTFFGQDYALLMSVQAGLFAVFPAVIYLIGVTLHSRPAGLIAAALASWRGVNALAGMTFINTSTAKHMLTDFPTGLGLAVFALFLVQWLQDPQTRWHKAALAAGTLGLTSLLRPHVMLILVIFLPVVFFVLLPNWRKGLAAASLGMLAFLAGIMPWTFFGGSNASIFRLYETRIRNVIEERYIEPQIPALPGGAPGLLRPSVVEDKPPEVPFQVSQFLNNLQTSAHTLPLTPQLLNLHETVQDGEKVWSPDWQGDLSAQGMLMLWLGLGVTALGLGAAANRSRLAGFSLPAVFLLYAAANAFARTSGGRYLVPMDWIVIVFFGLGLTVLLEAGQSFFKREQGAAESDPPAAGVRKSAHWGVKALGVVACFGIIGGLIPLSQNLHPLRFEKVPNDALVKKLGDYGLIETKIDEFLENNEAAALMDGAALYPRFLGQGYGIPSWPPYKAVEYPRTIFTLIGPRPAHVIVVLTGPVPDWLPHNSDVLVLGCKRDYEPERIYDALLVILPEKGVVYHANPERPLQCPVAEPICNNNKSCR